MLQKLKAIRFSKGTTQWFRSYLSERIFLVNIESKLSDFEKFSCVLGPLLFLIYVNDMSQAVRLTLLSYADDWCILYHQKKVDEIEKQLNEDFENICDWFVDNKRSRHFGEEKTEDQRMSFN